MPTRLPAGEALPVAGAHWARTGGGPRKRRASERLGTGSRQRDRTLRCGVGLTRKPPIGFSHRCAPCLPLWVRTQRGGPGKRRRGEIPTRQSRCPQSGVDRACPRRRTAGRTHGGPEHRRGEKAWRAAPPQRARGDQPANRLRVIDYVVIDYAAWEGGLAAPRPGSARPSPPRAKLEPHRPGPVGRAGHVTRRGAPAPTAGPPPKAAPPQSATALARPVGWPAARGGMGREQWEGGVVVGFRDG